jgi:iron complex outermembrane receptor protein
MSDKKDVPFEDNAVFNKEYTRNTTSIFLEHNLQISDFSLSGGAAFNYTKEYNTNLCGGIDLSYKAYDNLSYFLSLNNTMRMPTFTDLFYTGPSNIGNPDLLPEKAYTVESGIKYNNSVLRSTASVFVRKGKDLIDWIKENPEDTKWTTRNLTELTTVGFDISTYIYLSKTLNTFVPVNYLNISYTFTENSKSSEDYISYYVLDNLRHKLTLSLNHNLAFNIKADWKFSYQDRNGTYTKFNSVTLTPESEEPYNDLFILDAKLYLQQEYYTVYAEVSNILNNQVSDIPNVAIPGRWLKVGINTDLDL